MTVLIFFLIICVNCPTLRGRRPSNLELDCEINKVQSTIIPFKNRTQILINDLYEAH